MSKVKIIFYLFLCFIVFYIQPLEIGGLKGSLLTNAIVFIYFGLSLFSRKKVFTDKVGKSSVWLAFKILISPNIFEYAGPTFVDFFKFSIFPLFYHYLKNNVRSILKIQGLIKFFSVFVIISAIPYLLGILKPLSEGYKLDIFGEAGNQGFVGIFQNSHSAGVVLSLAIINLVFFIVVKNEQKYRLLFILMILIGCYAIFKTYVRTAYLTLIVGLIIVFAKQFKFKYIGRYVSVLILGIVVLGAIYANDATLRNRIEDNYQYKSGNEEEAVGSGRLVFQIAALDIWGSGSVYEKIFGTGVEKLTLEMEKRVHRKIHTHNGFTDALVKDGVIGLFVFVYFLWAVFKKIYRSKKKDYKTLCYATFFSYLFFQFVQGGIITPMIEIFLVFNLSLLNDFFNTEEDVKKLDYDSDYKFKQLNNSK